MVKKSELLCRSDPVLAKVLDVALATKSVPLSQVIAWVSVLALEH
jgi:hypothetical protein